MADVTGYYDKLTYGGNTPFIDATLRIKRAERHLRELATAADTLPRRRNYSFVIAKGEAGKLRIIFIPSNPMPKEFGAVVGDAIHNIRAAFDYVAVVISCPPYGSGDRDHIFFPTGKDRQNFIDARDGKAGRRGRMHGAKSEALRIVEELEPYDGGKHYIRELHKLDISDKHRLIVPTVSRLRVNELEFTVDGRLISLAGKDFQPNEDASNFTATIDCQGLDREQFSRGEKFDASFEIVFGKSYPFAGKPIIPTLSDLCDVAKKFIERCEKLPITELDIPKNPR